jgi:hypothetical protein
MGAGVVGLVAWVHTRAIARRVTHTRRAARPRPPMMIEAKISQSKISSAGDTRQPYYRGSQGTKQTPLRNFFISLIAPTR